MFINRFHRDPNPGEYGGTNPRPVGADLTDEEREELQKQTDAELLEQEELEKEAFNEDKTLKPGYLLTAEGKVFKDPNYVPPVEGLDEEGNVLEGYTKNEDGTVTKNVPDNQETEIDLESAKQFYDAVHALTGRPVEVDYGDVDPISPEGVALREKIVRESAIEEWDERLRQNNPRAYAYFLHTEAGKPDEEFFAEKSVNLPDREKLETSTDVQANIVKQALILKGVPEMAAQMTVDAYIKDNILKDKALEIQAEYEKAQADQLKNLEEIQRRQNEEFNSQVKSVLGMIDTSVTANSLRYVIPEAKQQDFLNFVKSKVQYGQDGNFYFTQPISQKELNTVLESMYIQYSGGNLKNIVEREATKLATNRLRATVNKDKANQTSSTDSKQSKQSFIPLGEL